MIQVKKAKKKKEEKKVLGKKDVWQVLVVGSVLKQKIMWHKKRKEKETKIRKYISFEHSCLSIFS